MSGNFTNLPGIFEQMQDGNLTITPTNTNPIVTVIGTASQGVGDNVYVVGSIADAATAFGLSGTLIRGLYEASVGGGLNFQLYRMGATPSELGTTFGVVITTAEEDGSAGTDYGIAYSPTGPELQVWNLNTSTLVYDSASGVVANQVNTGEVYVTGTVTNSGIAVGTVGSSTTASGLSSFAAVSGYSFFAGGNGLTMSRMQTYESLYKAYSLLQNQQSDVVIPMNVYLDDLNVMDMTAAQVATAGLTSLTNYPTQGSATDVLGKMYTENINGTDYFWWWFPTQPAGANAGTIVANIWPSGLAVPSSPNYVANVTASGSPALHVKSVQFTAANFHEVNFAYQLAQFLYSQSQVNEDMTGVVGTNPPISFGLKDVTSWVGTLPTVSYQTNTNGIITANGTGLLGNKFMSGRSNLSVGATGLPSFIINGIDGYFNGGFIATDNGFLDGTQQVDNNNKLIDIGKYINVVPTYPVLANSSQTSSYTANGSATYGGFYSVLPVSQAPTNQILANMRLPFRINTAKLDLLAGQRYTTFHQKTRGIVVSDGPTAARKNSDYNRLSTVRQVKAAVDAVRIAADPFLGQGMTGAMTSAFDTAIDNALGAQVKAGHIVRYQFNTIITPQMKVLGQATVQLKLVPAFELRQVTVVVALAAV
jgi:hypothetical protein